ncbi:MAG: hypothetical protein ACFCVG_09960 [Kineosporiaceae bacterium]
MRRFLAESGLELDDVHDGKRTWTDLRMAAGLPVTAPGEHDEALLRAVGRLTHVDDVVRLRGHQDLLEVSPEEIAGLPERERRLARMLVATLGEQVLERGATLTEGWRLLRDHPRAAAELRDSSAPSPVTATICIWRSPTTCRCRCTPGTRASRSSPGWAPGSGERRARRSSGRV